MTIIKAALSGDLHTNVPKRSDEARRIAYWMLEDWKARGVHLIGFGGDIVDGPMTERDRAWLKEYIAACADVAPVVLVDGNHEIELALRNAVSKMQTKHPVIVEDGAGVHVVDLTTIQNWVDNQSVKIAVACVSYPKKAQLLAHLGPASAEEVEEVTGQALQDIFRGLGVTVDQLGLPTVALVHGTIRGSKISDDQPDRPLGLDIALEDLTLMHADFYCVPHIHKAQHWVVDGVAVATPSSPFYTDYGEAKHEKGYLLVTIDTEVVNVTPGTCATWRRIPTPATPMLLLEANYSEQDQTLVWLANGTLPIMSTEPLPDIERLADGADIRLRYHFASDQRKAADEAANGIAGLLRISGAVNVTLDPVQRPTTKSRIPELAKTVRLEDKLKLYWGVTGFTPSETRAAVLTNYLHELQEEARKAGVAMGSVGRAAPTLKRVRGKGWLKFPNEFEINLLELERSLTAIIAPNEMGKSLLMQLMGPGVLYGTTPTRGSLDDLSVARDSYIEVVFDMGGDEYVLTQTSDGRNRTGHVSLLKNGKRELSKAGRSEYKAWAAQNLLPRSVYDAVICQSGTASIIELDDGPRVELLLRVLGLETYEVLAEMARKRTTTTYEQLQGVRARIQEIGIGGRPGISADLRSDIERLRGELDEAVQKHQTAVNDLVEARKAAADVETQRVEYNTLVNRRIDLESQEKIARVRVTQLQVKLTIQEEILATKEEVDAAVAETATLQTEIEKKAINDLRVQLAKDEAAADKLRAEHAALESSRQELLTSAADLSSQIEILEQRLTEARSVVTDAQAIRQAVAESEEFKKSLHDKRQELSEQRTLAAKLEGDLREVRARWNGNAQKGSELQRRRDAASSVLADKSMVLEAVESARILEADLATAFAENERYQKEVEFLRSELSQSSDKRIKTLRDPLWSIAQREVDDPVAVAHKAIEDDDQIVAEGEDTPLRLNEVVSQWDDASKKLLHIRANLEAVTKIAARQPQIDEAAQTVTELTAELEENKTLHESLTKESNKIIEQQVELEKVIEQTESDVRWLSEQIEGLEPLVGRAELLATADTKIQSLQEQIKSLNDREEACDVAYKRVVDQKETLTGHINDASHVVTARVTEIETAEQEIAALAAKIDGLKPLTDTAGTVALAANRVEEVRADLGDATDALDKVLGPLGDLNDKLSGITEPQPVDVSTFEAAVTSAQTIVTDYQTRLAVAEKDLVDAEAKERRQEELKAEERELDAQVGDWTALAQQLGKDGLQKEEISCAGPQLTEITNDLLRTAGDRRHVVSVETEKLHSNKKQMIPTLDINVFDSEEGITKESRRLSDAGKILVGEPFSLALVILGCQRAGIKSPTIFRDEATGVFDAVNAPRYIGMLHRFAEILDAQVLGIFQQPAIQEMADSRILIDNGRVTTA